jgi:hypothetical protein
MDDLFDSAEGSAENETAGADLLAEAAAPAVRAN